MSDSVPPNPAAEANALEYLQTWAASMTQVLGQISGGAFPFECPAEAPAEAVPPAPDDVHIIITTAGALRGEMSLRMVKGAALSLAQTFLSEPREAGEFNPEHRESLEELLRQVAGHAATALKPRWGEVQLRLEAGAAPTWTAGVSGWLSTGAGAPFPLWMEWQMSAALTAEMRSDKPAASEPSDTTGVASVSAPTPEPATSNAATQSAGKLDVFMGVELDVTLRFGGQRLLLREILQLTPGAVVELDRQINDQVDLLLDGKLIARGEVVVVDGNYGLRVMEVPSQLSQK